MPDSTSNHEGRRGDAVPPRSNAAAVGEGGDRVVDVDVSWLVPPDLGAVDALVRLQLAASRRRYWLQFHGADGGLLEFLEFVGLGEVVRLCRCCPSSPPCVGPPEPVN